MEIKLRRPVLLEEPLILTASLTRNTRKLIETEAKICLRDGTVVAESTATQFVVESKQDNAIHNQKGESQAND